MSDYNHAIYNFIREQIGDIKYAYARDYNANALKVLAEEHHSFPKYLLNHGKLLSLGHWLMLSMVDVK